MNRDNLIDVVVLLFGIVLLSYSAFLFEHSYVSLLLEVADKVIGAACFFSGVFLIVTALRVDQ